MDCTNVHTFACLNVVLPPVSTSPPVFGEPTQLPAPPGYRVFPLNMPPPNCCRFRFPNPPLPSQIMEKRHNFLHRQALLVRASVEQLSDADWARLKAHSLGPTSLGDDTPGNNRWERVAMQLRGRVSILASRF